MPALIALGANLHNQDVPPADTLRRAIDDINRAGFHVEKTSRFYLTPAFPAGSGPDYVNAAVQVAARSDLTPNALYLPLSNIELGHGRKRGARWGGRTLDIDLLAMEDTVFPDLAQFTSWAELDAALQLQLTPQSLILPHPRLHERAFVLVPLMDIAPDWRHPVFGKTVRQMHDALPSADRGSVIALTG